MKQTIFILITFLFFACQNKIRNADLLKLPSDSLINEVIHNVVILDSILSKNDSIYFALTLCPYTMWNPPREKDGTPPPAPSKYINPVAPYDFIVFFKERLKINLTKDDSIYFGKQIDSIKETKLIPSRFPDCNFVDLNYKRQRDCMRLDYIFVFYVPIFTADKKYVFVRYNHKGHGNGSILQDISGRWTRTKVFDTWNID